MSSLLNQDVIDPAVQQQLTANSDDLKKLQFDLNSKARWAGKSADQSGENWLGIDRLVPFRATSKLGDWGTADAEAAKIVGLSDTPIFGSGECFHINHILIVGASSTTEYIMRVIYGGIPRANLVILGLFSNFMFKFDPALPTTSPNLPVTIQMPEVDNNSRVWIEVKNASIATVDFYVGLHECAT